MRASVPKWGATGSSKQLCGVWPPSCLASISSSAHNSDRESYHSWKERNYQTRTRHRTSLRQDRAQCLRDSISCQP
ncbi:hypothetical protein QQF64_022784 [Cirrhinus molitorella]|uniref:Uncharacterized protein n=1 Tax=Cirrhinus molitorella TaxID=172907 RepID=A0ABR3L3I3_9TELE